MKTINYGPNMGKKFPSLTSVENFYYNGFGVESIEGFAPYEVIAFLEWTNDPGIGTFKCSDGQTRLIPCCQLTTEFLNDCPARPKLDPFKGNGVFFGLSSKS